MTGTETDDATAGAPLCLGCAQRDADRLTTVTERPHKAEPIPVEGTAKPSECTVCAYLSPSGWQAVPTVC